MRKADNVWPRRLISCEQGKRRAKCQRKHELNCLWSSLVPTVEQFVHGGIFKELLPDVNNRARSTPSPMALLSAKVFYHCLGPRMDVKFFVDRSDVATNGINADFHTVGYLLVGVAIGELIQKFLFARSQP